MRNYIAPLVTDIAQAAAKTNYWQTQVRELAATKGLCAKETQVAQRYLSVWSNDLESLQEQLDAQMDVEDFAYNTEYAQVD